MCRGTPASAAPNQQEWAHRSGRSMECKFLSQSAQCNCNRSNVRVLSICICGSVVSNGSMVLMCSRGAHVGPPLLSSNTFHSIQPARCVTKTQCRNHAACAHTPLANALRSPMMSTAYLRKLSHKRSGTMYMPALLRLFPRRGADVLQLGVRQEGLWMQLCSDFATCFGF